jgi:hypothetical protein
MAVSGQPLPAQTHPLLQCNTPFRACCHFRYRHGKIYVDEIIDDKDEETEMEQMTFVRHARRLIAGKVDVSGLVWAGPNSEKMDLV